MVVSLCASLSCSIRTHCWKDFLNDAVLCRSRLRLQSVFCSTSCFHARKHLRRPKAKINQASLADFLENGPSLFRVLGHSGDCRSIVMGP